MSLEKDTAAGDETGGGEERHPAGNGVDRPDDITGWAEFDEVWRSARSQGPIPATIDFEEAQRFLSRLDGNGRFGFRTFDDLKGRKDAALVVTRFGEFHHMRDELARLNSRGAGVFVTVNSLNGKGYSEEHVDRIRAVFLDLDQGGDKGRAALRRVLDSKLKPNLVYETSPGKFHCYWQVDGLPIDRFTDVQAAIIERFGGDKSIKDPPRVMRLPGFLHSKGDPYRVRMVYCSNAPARYSGAQIAAEFLPGETVSSTSHRQAEPLPHVLPEGEREKHLVSLAGSMRRRGAEEDEIYAALVPMNKRCDPRLEDKDLRRIAESIAKKPTAGGAGDFVRGEGGKIISSSQDNVRLAVARLGATVTHDVFADRLLIQYGDAQPQAMNDAAMDRLWLEIDATFGFRPTEGFFRTVVVDHARTVGAFHPVRDYLDGLTWDGTPRLDRWLIEHGGAADSEYCRAVSALMLIAAVRRVQRPGVKFDEMPVLESPQGTNKSSALATLCPRADWFTDDLPLNCGAKEVIERTAGKWIVEAGELNGMRKGDVEHLKGFLSRQVDVARLAYARIPTERPRHFIVVGTTNSNAYLKDSTGNRRFWPLRVAGFDLERLRQDRDQLWAEAAKREAEGASIRLDPALWPHAAVQQERRRIEDPWENALADVLGDINGKLLANDAWTIVGMHDVARRTGEHNARLGEAMTKLGFDRKQLRVQGQRKWHYVRGTEEEQKLRIVLDVEREEGKVLGLTARHENKGEDGRGTSDQIPF